MADTNVEPFEVEPRKCVRFWYTNYKGERSVRSVQPIEIFFGSTPHHEEPQWLMKAWDLKKNSYRSFALRDIEKPILPL